MDKREEAAALRESARVNGKAEALSDDDSDMEGDKPPAPIKVRGSVLACSTVWHDKRALEVSRKWLSCFVRNGFTAVDFFFGHSWEVEIVVVVLVLMVLVLGAAIDGWLYCSISSRSEVVVVFSASVAVVSVAVVFIVTAGAVV